MLYLLYTNSCVRPSIIIFPSLTFHTTTPAFHLHVNTTTSYYLATGTYKAIIDTAHIYYDSYYVYTVDAILSLSRPR